MDIRKLQRAIVDGLEDVKAQDIVVFNTEHLSPLFERVIIASGTSNRQTKALAASVRKAVKAEGFEVMRTEGEDNGEWIIVDCAAAVVHVMQPAIRQYYQLEEIWGDKPVAIKLKAAKTSLVKASEPEEDEPVKPKKAAGKVTATKKAATTAPTRKVAAKKVAAKKAAAPKSAPKAAPAKAPAVKKVAAKKVAVKKVAAKKVAAKKAPATIKKVVVNAPVKKKAPAAKKVAVKRVAAKKAPARKTAR
ncbi:MAG: ribosome silencing factor [Acidobacteriota bacterium]